MAGRTRWWKNGDHPRDDSEVVTDPETGIQSLSEGSVVRRFQAPDHQGPEIDTACGAPWDIHGWIDGDEGEIVHPGDWVVTHDNGTYSTVRPDPMADALAAAEEAAAAAAAQKAQQEAAAEEERRLAREAEEPEQAPGPKD